MNSADSAKCIPLSSHLPHPCPGPPSSEHMWFWFFHNCSTVFNPHSSPMQMSWQPHFRMRKAEADCRDYLGFGRIFPGNSDGKESACNAGDRGLISGLGRSPGGGNGNPLQCSCLENLHGQRSLAGCSPWGCKELDMTSQLSTYAKHLRFYLAHCKNGIFAIIWRKRNYCLLL